MQVVLLLLIYWREHLHGLCPNLPQLYVIWIIPPKQAISASQWLSLPICCAKWCLSPFSEDGDVCCSTTVNKTQFVFLTFVQLYFKAFSLSSNFIRRLGCFQAAQPQIPHSTVGWESVTNGNGKIHHDCGFNSQISNLKLANLSQKLPSPSRLVLPFGVLGPLCFRARHPPCYVLSRLYSWFSSLSLVPTSAQLLLPHSDRSCGAGL